MSRTLCIILLAILPVWASAQEACTDSLLRYARSHIGARYQRGASNAKAFDCSGFVMHVYGAFGVSLPHGSGSQSGVCEMVKPKEVQPGDLIFFSGRKVSKKQIGHVALITEVDGERIRMVHATTQQGVMEEWYNDSDFFTRRFIGVGRVKQSPKCTEGTLNGDKKKKGDDKQRE